MPYGLHPADRPKPIVIETPDDLFKLGVDNVDYASLGLPYLEDFVIAMAAGNVQASAMHN